MIFPTHQCAQILDGSKTQHRYRKQCRDYFKGDAVYCHYGNGEYKAHFQIGCQYPFQADRSAPVLGTIEIVAIADEVLRTISDADAKAEGFYARSIFFSWWRRDKGWSSDFDAWVWVVTFKLVHKEERYG